MVGGFTPGGRTTASDALGAPSRVLLRYNPRRRRSKRLPPAPTPRAAHALAAIRGRLYLAGGANDTGSLRSLEIYDLARRRWSRGSDFTGPARNHTTGVASGGLFYVLAGRDSRHYSTAERYDPRRRTWEALPNTAEAPLEQVARHADPAARAWPCRARKPGIRAQGRGGSRAVGVS